MALAEQQHRLNTLQRQEKELDQAHQQEVAKLYRPESTYRQEPSGSGRAWIGEKTRNKHQQNKMFKLKTDWATCDFNVVKPDWDL